MGPKAASPDERLQFILQCLHSIKDANGRPITPDWKAVAQVTGIKRNSCYVRYRDIVNKEIQNGVVGLSPVGSRATAAAAAAAQLQSLEQMRAVGSQPTPTPTPGNTAVHTASSSPVKSASRKRRRSHGEDDEEDDGDEVGAIARGSTVATKRMKDAQGSFRTTRVPGPSRHTVETRNIEPDITASFLDFDVAADFLAVDDMGLGFDCSSDADAEGEEDEF